MWSGYAKFIRDWTDNINRVWVVGDLTYCRNNNGLLEMFSHFHEDDWQLVPSWAVERIKFRGGERLELCYAGGNGDRHYGEACGRQFEIDRLSFNRPWILYLDALPGEKDLDGFNGGSCYVTRLRFAEEVAVKGSGKCSCDIMSLMAQGCQCGGE